MELYKSEAIKQFQGDILPDNIYDAVITLGNKIKSMHECTLEADVENMGVIITITAGEFSVEDFYSLIKDYNNQTVKI